MRYFLICFTFIGLGLDSGLVGLLLTYCFALTEPVEFWVRMTAELETAVKGDLNTSLHCY